MGKNVYSIVLSEEVVAEVDKKAYQAGISRSALINRILADKLGCETEDKRTQTIFDYIESSLSDAFKIINQASGTMFSVASPIGFKYRPVAKYLVELNGSGGRIRVEFRTSSADFLNYLNMFYEFFARLENIYLKNIKISCSEGRFIREFKYADGEKISAYIKIFDESMKMFFENINDIQTAVRNIEHKYRQYILMEKSLI